jgi:C-terminal processing protease CtpA/Prc
MRGVIHPHMLRPSPERSCTLSFNSTGDPNRNGALRLRRRIRSWFHPMMVFAVFVLDPVDAPAAQTGEGGIVAPTTSVSAAAYPRHSLQALQQDFDELRSIANSRHPKFFTDRVAFETLFVTQKLLLRDGMTEVDFLRLAAPVVETLHCGHSGLAMSESSLSGYGRERLLLPFNLKVIQNRLYVRGAAPGSIVPVGAEITAINGRSSAAILETLLGFLCSDGTNRTLKLAALNQDFSWIYHIYLDGSPDQSVTYVDSSGVPRSTVVRGTFYTDWLALADPVRSDNRGLGYSTFERDHAVLTIQSFTSPDVGEKVLFRSLVDEFFQRVAASGTSNLILDLRGNSGGDPAMAAHLFSYLINQPLRFFDQGPDYYNSLKSPVAPAANRFDGALYILIDGGCFSATGFLVSLLKYHQIGQFVGEESGGSFATTAWADTSTLSRTGVRFTFATTTFTTAVSGLTWGRGIEPDFPVTPEIDDYVNGWDAVMDFAVSRFRPAIVLPVIITPPPSTLSRAVGQSLILSVTATGVSGYQWAREGVPIAGANAASYIIPAIAKIDEGNYTVTLTNIAGSVTTATTQVKVAPLGVPASRTAFSNLSVRSHCSRGDGVAIGGFVISGSATKKILIRAVGPTLVGEGLSASEVLSDPSFTVHDARDGNRVIASNDDWVNQPTAGELEAVARRVGAGMLASTDTKSAALLLTLSPGIYSFVTRGQNDTTGIVLTEIYDADESDDGSVLSNVSVRSAVGSGNNVAIGGFVIPGDVPRRVLLRAIGPSLVRNGLSVEEVLSDPSFTVHDALNGNAIIAANDNSPANSNGAEIVATAARLGAAALDVSDTRSAALLLELPPGVYTFVSSGANGGSGIILTEVYDAGLAQ